MNMKYSLLVVQMLPALSMAAVFMELIDQHEDHPGKCFVDGVAHSEGDSWNSDSSCQRMTCTSYNQRSSQRQFLVITSTCPSVAAEPPCYQVVNSTASYPDCCPRFECPTVVESSSSTTLEEEDSSSSSASNQLDETVAAILDFSSNEIQHEENDYHIAMESQLEVQQQRVVAAPAEDDDEIASYDVTMGEDGDVISTDEEELFPSPSSPFRSFVQAPTRYGKPIVGGAWRK